MSLKPFWMCVNSKLLISISFTLLLFSQGAIGFVLYDDIGQSGKPDLKPLGFTALRAIPEKELLSLHDGNLLSDNDKIRSAIEKYRSDDGVICLDIETWGTSMNDVASFQESVQKYVEVGLLVKSIDPSVRFGFYGMLPVRNYYTPIKGRSHELASWAQRNQQLAPVADVVDIIFPSLYTFNDDVESWVKYAVANLEQAATYEKPVIAFLWPQIHQSNRFYGLDFVDYHFWKTQLETVYKRADGIVIWSPWGAMRTEFDPDAPWWKATVDFIHEKALHKSSANSVFRPSPPVSVKPLEAQ